MTHFSHESAGISSGLSSGASPTSAPSPLPVAAGLSLYNAHQPRDGGANSGEMYDRAEAAALAARYAAERVMSMGAAAGVTAGAPI